uniref:Microtubule associated protein 9 n=1 Tax=Varanus komodoensis TaxID=61221 RepID=A0A8D2IPL3_VARKO
PQPRSVLRKSSHVEDYEGTKAEDRASYSRRSFSLSAPSSKTSLNNQVLKFEKRALSESPGPEASLLFFTLEDEPKEMDNCNDLRLQESGRESPSVIELMMTTVYEKNKKAHKSTEDYLEEKLQALEHSATEDGPNVKTKDDKSEQKVTLNISKSVLGASKDSVKVHTGREIILCIHQSPIPTSTSSQYLGTLKVLDNKHLQKYSAELDKADSLRAAVYQVAFNTVWGVILSVLSTKEAAKKEEALASFEAWKAMKQREAKKMAEKKRLEEAKKKEEAELNEKKKEEAQKAFEKWKEKKAEYLKQQIRREKRIERLKKKKEEEIVAEKKKDSRSAVEKWNEKKEEFMKQKKKEKIQERKKQVEDLVEKQAKDKRAIEEYEKWLVSKEMNERIQSKQKKLQVILEDETPPPWSPPGKAVSSRSY